MAEPMPPLHDPENPDAWAVAYVDGRLSAADRATFEEHLSSHAECREQVELLRVAFPAYGRVLMEDGPPRPIAEVMKIVEAAEAKLKVKARPPRRPFWALGGGFAALASAAAAYFVFLQPVAGIEPDFLEAAAQVAHAPRAGPDDAGPPPPLPPPPANLVFTTRLHSGELELDVLRDPVDAFSAVALIDASGQAFLVKPGNLPDSACDPGCPALNLRVKLDRLAPGPFRVVALVSTKTIATADLRGWLPLANRTAPLSIGARAYAVVMVDR